MDTAPQLFPDPPHRPTQRPETDNAVKKMFDSFKPSPDEGIDWSLDEGVESPSGQSVKSQKNSSPLGSLLVPDVINQGSPAVSSGSGTSPGSDNSEHNRARKPWCSLHERIIDQNSISKFIKFCEDTRAENAGQPIEANCANGLDQVGFFLCGFLVKSKNWQPEAAISAVRKAREPGICDRSCVDGLFAKYGHFGEDCVVPSNSVRPTLDGVRYRATQLLTQIPGVSLIEDCSQAEWVREIASQLCGYSGKGFPGALMGPLGEEQVPKLAKAAYKVTWKSDGIRLLMVVTNPGETYLLSEDNDAFEVPGLCFPYGEESETRLFTTLLDGEMVFDRDGGRIIPRYLIRDILHLRVEKIWKMNFNVRAARIQRDIIDARSRAAMAGRVKLSDEPFSIRKKDHFVIESTHKLLAGKFRSQVLHRVDGVLFQPVNTPYTPGVPDSIFEWELPSSPGTNVTNSVRCLLDFVRYGAAKEPRKSPPPIEGSSQCKRPRED